MVMACRSDVFVAVDGLLICVLSRAFARSLVRPSSDCSNDHVIVALVVSTLGLRSLALLCTRSLRVSVIGRPPQQSMLDSIGPTFERFVAH